MYENFSADSRREKTTTPASDPIATSRRFATLTVASPPAQSDMFFHATLARAFIQSLRLHGDDDFVDRYKFFLS